MLSGGLGRSREGRLGWGPGDAHGGGKEREDAPNYPAKQSILFRMNFPALSFGSEIFLVIRSNASPVSPCFEGDRLTT